MTHGSLFTALHKHELAPGRKRPGAWLNALVKGAADPFLPLSRPLLLAFSLTAGAAVYFSLGAAPAPEALGLLLAAATTLLVISYCLSSLYWLLPPALMVFGLAAGAAVSALRTELVRAPVISEPTGPVMVEGWLENLDMGPNGPRLTLRVHAIAGLSQAETPVLVRVTHRNRLEMAPGRFVRCWAVLRPPPAPAMRGDYDFARQAWFGQLGAVGYVQGRCRGGAAGAPRGIVGPLRLKFSSVRRTIGEHVNEASGARAGGFAAALVSGDRSFMSREDQEALRASGLAHLLAISGLHLAIVGGLIYFLVRRMLGLIEPVALRLAVHKPAALAAILGCLAYLVLSGASVPTQRAFIMAVIFFGAILFDRSAFSLRTFALAMIAIVLVHPESVVTPGFQMSFAATGALIASYDIWRRWRAGREQRLGPIGFSWASILVTSVVAGAVTGPFAIYHFERISGWGLVANLAAMPIVTFLSAPSAALAMLGAPFGQADPGLKLFGYSLELVLGIAHWTAGLSGNRVVPAVSMPAASLVLFVIALATAIAMTGLARVLAGAGFLIPAFLIWQAEPRLLLHWSQSGDVFFTADNGTIQRVRLARGEGLPPMRFADREVERVEPAGTQSFSLLGGRKLQIDASGDDIALYILTTHEESATVMQPDYRADWDDIRRNGAQTVRAGRRGLLVESPLACGNWPWRPCLSYPGEQAPRPP